jgi:predicted transposase YbfD/YdcC
LRLDHAQKLKQTNEIKIAAPLLAALDIDGMTITADALLTQREFARHLVEDRNAHYHFTAKGNQALLLDAIKAVFEHRAQADAQQIDVGHGRVETRKIWVSSAINAYVNFPYVAQVFAIERESINKKTGQVSRELIYGLTSQADYEASPEKILEINRGHWCIENSCHYILDWLYDEDRCRIRTLHGPENISRLRRFVIGIIKATSTKGVTETTRTLVMNTRMVFDYLKMSGNTAYVRG